MTRRTQHGALAGLHESLEKVLHANSGRNYCASCLADAGGLRSPEDRVPVARLMRSAYTKVTDRAVETGTCARCAETSPDAERLVVTPLACSLVGREGKVSILPATRTARLYGATEATEHYYCSYGVNPDYRCLLEGHGLRVSAVDDVGEVRAVELPDHPFFVATLFQPQNRSTPAEPHPLFVGFAAAVSDHIRIRGRQTRG
jgi:CTP synthase (UTP-ammonia lyase)